MGMALKVCVHAREDLGAWAYGVMRSCAGQAVLFAFSERLPCKLRLLLLPLSAALVGAGGQDADRAVTIKPADPEAHARKVWGGGGQARKCSLARILLFAG